ncbi:MAG: hypothetical protein ACRDJV_07240 [Actinomycetota bacterium]
MKSAKTAALVLAALILPLLLAATTYLISAGSFEAPGGAAIRLENAALASPRPDRSPSRPKGSNAGEGKSDKDESGPCDEAEHADDPRCAGGDDDDDDDDNSGPGSDDSGSDPDSDNSGPGSDNSGSGSDNSGPGSDNSGSGSSGGDD